MAEQFEGSTSRHMHSFIRYRWACLHDGAPNKGDALQAVHAYDNHHLFADKCVDTRHISNPNKPHQPASSRNCFVSSKPVVHNVSKNETGCISQVLNKDVGGKIKYIAENMLHRFLHSPSVNKRTWISANTQANRALSLSYKVKWNLCKKNVYGQCK